MKLCRYVGMIALLSLGISSVSVSSVFPVSWPYQIQAQNQAQIQAQNNLDVCALVTYLASLYSLGAAFYYYEESEENREYIVNLYTLYASYGLMMFAMR